MVLIERWCEEYNTLRPHSALGNLPPASETVESNSQTVCLNTNSNFKGVQRMGAGQHQESYYPKPQRNSAMLTFVVTEFINYRQ